jgi:hypothetical protein
VKEIEREARERDRDGRQPALAFKRTSEARLDDAHEAILAAGQLAPFDGPVLDDEGEGDGHHGEVGPRHANGRHRQQRADEAGDEAGSGQSEPEARTLQRQDADHIGADGIEADMADGELARRGRRGC